MEKYSVLMSLYKKEKPEYLAVAIESMLNQTVQPDEIVIVKDGPLTDELEKVLKGYTDKYPELFNIVESRENVGLGRALNLGLEHCRNELVARMDTDDIAILDRCEKQIEFLKNHHEVAIVGGQIEEFVGVESNVVGKRIVPCQNQEIRNFLKSRCPFNHMTVMFRKSDVIGVGNYLDCFWDEDYFLWIRMEIGKCNFANLPTVLVHVRTDINTYKRRGGKRYFKSEIFLQKYMLKNGVINRARFVINIIIRVLIQLFLPNFLRQWVFRNFARVKST